jgi:hypothetical protein
MSRPSLRSILVLLTTLAACSVACAQQNPVITLRRTSCFGPCPVYSLDIFEDGSIRYVGQAFVQVTGEQRAAIPPDAVRSLISDFLKINYFALQDDYEGNITDLPTTYTSLRLGARTKSIKDYAHAPKELVELEYEIDRVANTHRWIDGGKDDLKQWQTVQADVYRRIKPGMNPLMQAAGQGDLPRLELEHNAGVGVDAADETGWTALMLASVMCQENAVRRLLDWGAKIDLRDKNGDTALIGASAAFCVDKDRAKQTDIVRLLLSRGAPPDAQDLAGESALMAVTAYGNDDAARALLDSGARPQLRDAAGRTALDYAQSALKQYSDRFWADGLREIVTDLQARQ